LLGAERITALAARLGQIFELLPDCQHVFELDPRYVTRELARTLACLGVNRVSLGIQEFAAHVQTAIGRFQPYVVVERAVLALREAGIRSINFDLMYGLPRQTTEDIRRTVELATSLGPQRVAYFGYAHVPWFKTRQRLIDEATLPDALQRLAQAEAAHHALSARGYVAVGLDHFARPDDELAVAARSGRLRRNFQGYTSDDSTALIGFGASAIGRLPQGYVQNLPDTGGYSRAIAAGRLATARGLVLSDDDRVRARVIERLMCDFDVDLDEVADRGETDGDFHSERAALMPLVREGLVKIAGSRISVTKRGRPFVRVAAAAFDAYLQKENARHSPAV
jgi:oxygen-independent coproporphyrinogen-3 oxidase